MGCCEGLKAAGCTAAEMKGARYTAIERKAAGCSADEIKAASEAGDVKHFSNCPGSILLESIRDEQRRNLALRED